MTEDPVQPERFAITAITRFAHARLLEIAEEFGGREALAKELGISVKTLSNWINLRTMPKCGRVDRNGERRRNHPKTKAAVRRLCELGNASPEELFPGYVRERLTGRSTEHRITRQLTRRELSTLPRQRLTYYQDSESIEAAEKQELREKIEDVLKTLTYREREIIKLRYGLGSDPMYTLEEVGHIFKVTRDRIRQIEMKALNKLRQNCRASELLGFLD